VLDEHLPLAMDVLSDIVLNQRSARRYRAREEGRARRDQDGRTPDDLVHELFTQDYRRTIRSAGPF
jgi:hypothetical protein